MARAITKDQHPPLPVPEKWGQSEKRFVIQLEILLDAIYKRIGDLDRRLAALEEEE